MFILNNFHTKIIVFKFKWLNLETMFSEQLILLSELSEKERKFFLSLSEKRKREFLGVRYALRSIGIMNIFYNEKRKPFLLPKKKGIIIIFH